MASSVVTPWRIVGNSSNTDATSYATASTAGASGHVVIAVVTNYKASTSTEPTLSGTNGYGVTWTKIASVETNSDGTHFCRITAFWGVLASAVAGVLTFSFGADTQLAAVWDVWDMGALINTTTPIVQSKTSSDISATTSFALTQMDAAPTGTNPVLVIVGQQAASAPALSSVANAAVMPGNSASATTASDGLALRMYQIGTQGYTMQGMTASVAKVGILVELQNTVTAGGGFKHFYAGQ